MNEDLALLDEGAAGLGIVLTSRQQSTFAAYAGLLATWNERFNLLGPSAIAALWSRHFLDALTLVSAMPDVSADDASVRCLDVGSGAGIPGLPLAIAFPNWQVTLLEATAKKARFLEMAVRELGLEQVAVVQGRAEELAHDPALRERFDVCVARAVTRTAALLEFTLPFVSRGGTVVLYKGLSTLSDELRDAEPARVILGASQPAVIPVTVPDSGGRCLVRYQKVGPMPNALPRRAGLPEHKALTASDVARFRTAEAHQASVDRRSRR